MTRYGTSQDLLEKVRTGKGDPEIYSEFINLYIDNIFGGSLSRTRELKIKQNSLSGENDLRQAKAAKYSYYIDTLRHPEYSLEVYMKWEEALQDASLDFNEKSTYIRT